MSAQSKRSGRSARTLELEAKRPRIILATEEAVKTKPAPRKRKPNVKSNSKPKPKPRHARHQPAPPRRSASLQAKPSSSRSSDFSTSKYESKPKPIETFPSSKQHEHNTRSSLDKVGGLARAMQLPSVKLSKEEEIATELKFFMDAGMSFS